MAVKLRKVRIENFRSIKMAEIDLTDFSVFVGKNDCGKSNILRALNLFFNEETNYDTEFDFDDDYNFFAQRRARRAEEISIKIELSLPETYHRTNGEIIVWEKKFRRDGLHTDKYHGIRLRRNRLGRFSREKVEIPDRSNVHTLLNRIEFEYVPAIKDNEYFDGLRGRIYEILSEVAAQTFRDSSGAFEDSIGEHLTDLTADITRSLGIDTKLALPRDLSHIFERLDFLSGEGAVSLNNRGDGIKVRHIPLILKFMADKKNSLQVKGAMPYSFIWAYEEPENNLEFRSAVQLAGEISSLAKNGTANILLTTHSPVFYDIADKDEDISLHHVYRDTDDEGTRTKSDISLLDENIGTLALLAPRIAETAERIRSQEQAIAAAEQLAEQNRAKIFIEGTSDKIILERSLELFYPEVIGEVDFETKTMGAGHKYVIDMLAAWRGVHKHHPDGPKSAGIVDSDANKEKSEFNAGDGNVKSAKCFCYGKPQSLIPVLRAGFKIPITLEALYQPNIWENANQSGHLVLRDKNKILSDGLKSQLLNEEISLADITEEAWELYALHDFHHEHKVSTAQRIARLPEAEAREQLENFRLTLGESLHYLGLIEDHPLV